MSFCKHVFLPRRVIPIGHALATSGISHVESALYFEREPILFFCDECFVQLGGVYNYPGRDETDVQTFPQTHCGESYWR